MIGLLMVLDTMVGCRVCQFGRNLDKDENLAFVNIELTEVGSLTKGFPHYQSEL